MSKFDVFFHDDRQGNPRRAEYGEVIKNGRAVQSGHGWEYSPDILKAFTQRCVLDESNLANSKIKVLNVATVDVQGVIISASVETL